MNAIFQKIIEKKYFYLSILFGVSLLALSLLYFRNVQADEAFQCPTTIVDEEEPNSIQKDILHIDIKGAIKKPGVYEMHEGNLVNDVISKAGGILSNASTENLNLSKRLVDEMVIVVYTKEEIAKYKESQEGLSGDGQIKEEIDKNDDEIKTPTTSNKVSLNTGTLEELETLPGIGEAKAKSIIAYREKCGAFKKIEDIKNISGIGDAVYDKLKAYITI